MAATEPAKKPAPEPTAPDEPEDIASNPTDPPSPSRLASLLIYAGQYTTDAEAVEALNNGMIHFADDLTYMRVVGTAGIVTISDHAALEEARNIVSRVPEPTEISTAPVDVPVIMARSSLDDIGPDGKPLEAAE